ncbi:MAG: hypothetical protein EZS28_053540, partial [Streblomastix strix]
MKDNEMIQGAMKLVRECVYMILYEKIYRWNILDLCRSLVELQKIIDETEDIVLLNLVETEILSAIHYIIEECTRSYESLLLKEKAILIVNS